MRERIKHGILGCGVIAEVHAQAIKACPEIELYAVCDIIGEKAVDFARRHGVSRHYTNYQDMLSLSELDSVSICTPSGLHADMVMDCARNGKHVLCEKPMDIHQEKLDAMIASCRENKVKLACVFQNRTYSGTKTAKQLLEKHELGKILIANAYGKEYRSPEYYKSAGWRGTWELDGGGCMMNQNVHCLDLLLWWAGEVESVEARTYTLAREIDVEDSAFMLLKFRGGAKGQYAGGTLYMPGHDDYVEIQCERGRIVYDTGETTLYRLNEKGGTTKIPLDEDEIVLENTASDPTALSCVGHKFFISDLAQAILQDREPYISGESGRRAVDLILKAYDSSRQKKELSF